MLGSNCCVLAQKAQNLKNQDYLDLSALARQRAANSLTNKPKIIPVREFEISQVPGPAADIPILKRAVILALNWHAEVSFDAITIKVHINGGYNTP